MLVMALTLLSDVAPRTHDISIVVGTSNRGAGAQLRITLPYLYVPGGALSDVLAQRSWGLK